jgi:WD40 repeat protein
MAARRFLRASAAVLGLSLGAAAAASAQPETGDDEALRRELVGILNQQGAPGKAGRPGAVVGPPGAVARLGDSRLRHAGRPLCLTFSPDGKRVVSGGEDGTVRVWDAATGEAVNVVQMPESSVQQVQFTHGGTRIAALLGGGRLRFLNPDDLKEIGQYPTPVGGEFAVSGDGRLIAHASADGLQVTEVEHNLARLEVPAGSPVRLRPDHKSIAVADAKGVVILYQLAGGKPLATLDNGGALTGMAFSPDGKRLACGVGTVAKVWDLTAPKAAKVAVEVKDAGRVGEWLDNNRLTAGDATAAGVYDLAAGKWAGRARGISGAWAVSPDGTRIAATGTTGLRVRLWDLTNGNQLLAENDTFPEPALVLPAPDGKAVFLLAGDQAFAWPLDQRAATPAGTLPAKAVLAAAGKGRLAVAMAEGVALYDDFDPSKPLAAKPSRTLTEAAAGCRALAVSPDGSMVAYCGEAAQTVVLDAATGKPLRTLPVRTVALSLAFSPTGDTIAVLGRDGFLRAFPSGDPLKADLWKVRVQRGQKGTVAFSPDGKLIASSSSGQIKVVSAADGAEVLTVGGLFENGLVQQVAFSPNGRLLLAASEGAEGGVRVWELATGAVVRTFATGYGTIYRLGVFGDGTRVASAGAEEAITVWDLTGRHGRSAPAAPDLATAWGVLGSPDAAGHAAAQVLAAGGDKSVPVIATGVAGMRATRTRVAQRVKELGSDDFNVREAAARDLVRMGAPSLSAVLDAAAKSDSAEVRKRASDVVTQLGARGVRPTDGLAADALRLYRAVEVLEDIGTKEARELARDALETGPGADAVKATRAKLGKK